MQNYLLTTHEINKWLQLARIDGSISSTLRQLAKEYGFNKYQTASAAAEIFEESMSGEDHQVLWKWKLSGSDDGFDDEEIDALLAHLLSVPIENE